MHTQAVELFHNEMKHKIKRCRGDGSDDRQKFLTNYASGGIIKQERRCIYRIYENLNLMKFINSFSFFIFFITCDIRPSISEKSKKLHLIRSCNGVFEE